VPRPRPLWTGSISFGLVNVPVRMFAAVREHKLQFHYVHEPDGSPEQDPNYLSQNPLDRQRKQSEAKRPATQPGGYQTRQSRPAESTS